MNAGTLRSPFVPPLGAGTIANLGVALGSERLLQPHPQKPTPGFNLYFFRNWRCCWNHIYANTYLSI